MWTGRGRPLVSRPSLHACMKQEDPAHLLNGFGLALNGMARPHDQFGLDPLDVGARILHDPVVALLDRALTIDCDNRMGLDRTGGLRALTRKRRGRLGSGGYLS